MNAHFGDIASIGNGTWRNIKNSRKSESNQFAQLWAVFKYDYQKHQAFFAKSLKKQASYQYNFENQQGFQCYFHSRTAIVVYSLDSEFF